MNKSKKNLKNTLERGAAESGNKLKGRMFINAAMRKVKVKIIDLYFIKKDFSCDDGLTSISGKVFPII